MSIAVTCPECQSRFDLPDDLADQPIRCHRCDHTFDSPLSPGGRGAGGEGDAREGITVKAVPKKKPVEDEPPPRPYRANNPRSL